MDDTIKVALETIQMNKQALLFVPSRASAEKTAEDLSKLTAIQLPELEKEILHVASTPTKQCRRLSHCIRKGIAFHHAGLLSKQKELIEDEFRKGTIKIICCTPTLASGLSMPAFRVIIKSLKRYTGSFGMDWIQVLEYLQMAGRAGRPEYEKFGEAITIAKDDAEKEEIYERYICGVPEDIYSKLAVEPVLRTYLLSLISSGIIRDQLGMRQFFAQTFWAKQFGDMQKLESILNKMAGLLEEWGFIMMEGTVKKDLFIVAKNMDKPEEKRLRATLLGKRISELYLDPLTARHILDCLQRYGEGLGKSDEGTCFGLLQMIAHTLEMRPLLSVKRKDEDNVQEALNKRCELLLQKEPSAFEDEYDEFMKSIKTSLFFEAWIDEKDEDYLMETFDIRPGEIRVKLELADWLLYAAEEMAKLNHWQEHVKEIVKLRLRIKDGVREELLVLLKLKGIGRVRARRLFNQGIKDIGDVKKVDLASLSQILGKAVAEDVKKQVGEEIKEVPKGTRKGQLSMEKF